MVLLSHANSLTAIARTQVSAGLISGGVARASSSVYFGGRILVIHQVERLVDEGAALGNKQLAEYLKVKGYADAARWTYV